MDADTKTGLDALKTATEKVAHKAAEATGEFIWNKIADKIANPKPVPQANSRNIQETATVPEKNRRNTKWIKKSIIRWNTEIYKLLNDSSVLNIRTKKWTKLID